MIPVKICGICSFEDAAAAVEAGARAVGFIFHAPSPRAVSPARAAAIVRELPPGVAAVGVFVNEPRERLRAVIEEVGLGWAQLSGDEDPPDCEGLPVPVIKALRVRSATELPWVEAYDAAAAILIDAAAPGAYGGTGTRADWPMARAAKVYGRPIILAGGIGPDDAAEALGAVAPAAIDVCSGVEARPGVKDPARLRALFDAVQAFEAGLDDAARAAWGDVFAAAGPAA